MDTAKEKQYLIVGLGNPGKEYARTRHNMGFLVLQTLAQAHGWHFKREQQFTADVAKGKIEETNVHLILPLTYMNESGRTVKRYMDFYRLGIDSLIVVCDDTAIPFGQIRVRSQGSPGGHNGLKSIQALLHTRDYIRLRMGIGKEHRQPLAHYVLDSFTHEEQFELEAFLERGTNVLKRLIKQDIAAVMSAVNVKVRSSEDKGQL